MMMMETYLTEQQSHLKIQNNLFITSKYSPAGELLLTQAPLTMVPLASERLTRCNYCLRKGTLQCCSRCRSACFCDNDCFLKAWVSFHNGLCSKEQDKQDKDRTLLERTTMTIQHLASHGQSTPILNAFHSLEVPKQLTDIPLETKQFLEKSIPVTNTTLEKLYSAWKRIQISSFNITDPDSHLDTVGIGLYPITTQYVRHSCRPNAALKYKNGGYQCIIALEDISENTPITISYVDLMATKKQRHAELEKKFGFLFECDCARCQGPYKGLDELFDRGEQLNVNPEELQAALEVQLKTWDVLAMVKEYAVKDLKLDIYSNDALGVSDVANLICRLIVPDIYTPALSKRVDPTLTLPPFANQSDDLFRIVPAIDALVSCKKVHSPFFTITAVKLAEKWLAHLISENRWVEASRCTIYLFMLYRLVYSSLHPKMVYHTLLLTRASWNSLVQLELAGIGKKLEHVFQNAVILWIEVATATVRKTFGQDTVLWRELVELKWLFERDQKIKLNE